MPRLRSTLAAVLVLAVMGLVGCRDRSDQPVRTEGGSTTDGEAPATAANPAVASPSTASPTGGIDQTVLILLGPAGLSIPGLGSRLGLDVPGSAGGVAGSGGGGGQGAGSAAGTDSPGTGVGTGPGGAGTGGAGTGGQATGGAGAGGAGVGGQGTGGQGTGGQGTGGQGTGGTGTANGTAFCGPAKALSAALESIDPNKDPDSLRSAVAQARSAFATARAAAPPKLIGDVDVLAGAYGQLFSSMEEAGYDLKRLSVGALSPLLAPEVKASSGRLRDYVNNDC